MQARVIGIGLALLVALFVGYKVRANQLEQGARGEGSASCNGARAIADDSWPNAWERDRARPIAQACTFRAERNAAVIAVIILGGGIAITLLATRKRS